MRDIKPKAETVEQRIEAAWQSSRGVEEYDPGYPVKASQNFIDGYRAGIADALDGLWRSVDDELPDENEEVLCMMKSNNAIVGGFITKQWNDYPKVATAPDFHFEDYGGYECSHWMPIPPLLPDGAEKISGNHFREVGKMVDKGIVCVKWLDSYGVQSGWREIDDFKANPLEITSIGKIIYEDDDVISLAHNFADETENTVAQANGIMTIPRVCIRQIISCVYFCPEPESTQMRQPS